MPELVAATCDDEMIAVRHRKGLPSQKARAAYRPKEFELNGRVYKGLQSLMLTFYCKEVATDWT